jgi:anti-sigma regulatory factor (Ser/Thr protein kinase)
MGTHASTADRPPSETRSAGRGLQRRPAHGSVTLSTKAAQPHPRTAWVTFLSVHLESAKRARDWTALFLESCEDGPAPDADVTVLVVSELVANAVKATAEAMASGSFTGLQFVELSLRLFNDRLLIEVIDSSTEIPTPKLQEDPEALDWRGLAVVDHLSEAWDWHWHMGHTRKVVWCKLTVAPTGETREA